MFYFSFSRHKSGIFAGLLSRCLTSSLIYKLLCITHPMSLFDPFAFLEPRSFIQCLPSVWSRSAPDLLNVWFWLPSFEILSNVISPDHITYQLHHLRIHLFSPTIFMVCPYTQLYFLLWYLITLLTSHLLFNASFIHRI